MIKKGIALELFMYIGLLLMTINQSGEAKEKSKPIPIGANWEESLKSWVLNTEKIDGKYQTWFENGKKRKERYSLINMKLYYYRENHQNGNSKNRYQAFFGGMRKEDEGEFPNWAKYGKQQEWDEKGRLTEMNCWSYEDPSDLGLQCGTQIFYNPNGTIKEKKVHNRKCHQGCGEFIPEILIAEYEIKAENVSLLEKPDSNAKKLATLKKGERVRVVEDAKEFLKIGDDTAPWVKCKTKNGLIGYVYGVNLNIDFGISP